jgi:phasin family protein
MYQTPEQLVAFNKSCFDAAVRLAGIAFAGTERLLEVQMKAAKTAFTDSVEQAQSLAEIKDPQELAKFKGALTQPVILEKTTSYVKSVYDVASATQAEFSKLAEEQITEFNKNAVVAFDTLMKSAPAGSEAAVAAVKSALSTVNAAYDNLTKSTKQIVELTQANVEAATTPIIKKKAA